MGRRRRHGIVAGLTWGVVAAALVTVRVTGAAPVPEPEQPEIQYVGVTYDPRDPDILRRLRAGEDPATIPGVHVMTGDPRPPEPSVPAHR